MLVLKNSAYRLAKYFLALLLMTNFCSAFAGAVIIKDSDIRSICYGDQIEICLSTETIWRSIDTPSGNEIITVTGEDNVVMTDLITNLIIFSENRTFKERFLKKAGELHNEFNRSHISSYYNNGICTSIVWEDKYIYTNGQILLDQENNEEITCD